MSLAGYFSGIVVFSVALNLVSLLYPNDKSGVRRALDVCLSLCLLCAIISPIGSMLNDAKESISLDKLRLEMPDAEVGADAYYALEAASEKEIEARILKILSSEFDLEDVLVESEVSVGEEGIALRRVDIYLYGKGLLTDPQKIKSVMALYTDAECRIIEGRK